MSIYPSFKFYSVNGSGRDFVVGDIHGMFSSLDELLKHVQFNTRYDRLFSVGDLIDRGLESERAIDYIVQPWFHAILGNHEQMLLDAEHDEETFANWVRYNGGKWWKKTDSITKAKFRILLQKLPIAIEIKTNDGKVGLLHADIASGYTWSDFVSSLDKAPELKDHAIWSRNGYKDYCNQGMATLVKGIDLIIFGHTPVDHPIISNNTCFLDTGAPYTEQPSLAKLSLLQIHPKRTLHQISTLKKKKKWSKW